MKRKAFTLIELLIVVAIIAILAAIAVPNFLEAQTRSKVSRVASDMRSMATALEAYYVDFNRFPPDRNYAGPAGIAPFDSFEISKVRQLTTPIAYMTTLDIQDPFLPGGFTEGGGTEKSFRYYNMGWGFAGPGGARNWGDAVAAGDPAAGLPKPGYLINSRGPDKIYQASEWLVAGIDYVKDGTRGIDRVYDPSNGTVSVGDISRAGGAATTGLAK